MNINRGDFVVIGNMGYHVDDAPNEDGFFFITGPDGEDLEVHVDCVDHYMEADPLCIGEE